MKIIFICAFQLIFFFNMNAMADQSGNAAAAAAYKNGQYSEALAIWRPLADKGDSIAQFNVGSMYGMGKGVPQNLKEAEKWNLLSANQGYAPAQFNIATMYDRSQKYDDAVKWYRLAAAQNHAQAQFNLGSMYFNGQGIPKDYVEAMKWNKLAAKQGIMQAQDNLGVMYAKGWGTQPNATFAYIWFTVSASIGNDRGAKISSDLAKTMTPDQLAKAKNLADQCIKSKFKSCDFDS
jgi:TPR repeat protein